MNFGPRGTKLTVGIPGTGLSYQTKLTSSTRKRANAASGLAEVERSRAYHPDIGQRVPVRPRRLGMVLGACAVAAVGLLVIGVGGRTTPAAQSVASVTTAIAPPAAASEEALFRDVVEVAAVANIREAPRPDARVVGLAGKRERYEVFGRSGAWTQVGKDAAVGWVGNSRLTPARK